MSAIASLVKIFLGQTLDSNLSHPREAFLMTFLCTLQLYAAYKLTSKYHFKLVLLREIPNRQYLKVLFWVAYPLGTLCFLIGACIPSYASTAGEGFQTFMLPILIAAVVARTAYLISDPTGRRELDGTLVFMLGTSFLLAFLANLKFVAVIMLMAYVVTIVVRKKSASLKLVLFGGAGLAVAVRRDFSADQPHAKARICRKVRRTVDERADDGGKARIDARSSSNRKTFGPTWRAMRMARGRTVRTIPYFGNTGSYGTLLERVGMVQHVDIIKSGIDSNGELGIWPAGWAFQHAVPRVLNGEKTQDSMCDIMFAHAGLLPKGLQE